VSVLKGNRFIWNLVITIFKLNKCKSKERIRLISCWFMSKCGTHTLVVIRMQKRSGSFPVIAPPLQLLALDVRLLCPCHAFSVLLQRETSLMSNLSPSRKEEGKRMTQTSVTCNLSNSCGAIITGENRKAYCFRQTVIFLQLWCSSTNHWQ